jgi:uncharacterized protein
LEQRSQTEIPLQIFRYKSSCLNPVVCLLLNICFFSLDFLSLSDHAQFQNFAEMAVKESSPAASLIAEVEKYVREYMKRYDGSHDFAHIQRVVRLAIQIGCEEETLRPGFLDHDLIHLAALMHDVNDRKYISESSMLISEQLKRLGCDESMAQSIETIVTHVSFTKECDNPETVAEIIGRIPELGVVQDADRIDAVGAIGIGRLFTYGGARDRDLEQSMDHFEERLMRTGDRMKTATGKAIISERMRRLEIFQQWWDEETCENPQEKP